MFNPGSQTARMSVRSTNYTLPFKESHNLGDTIFPTQPHNQTSQPDVLVPFSQEEPTRLLVSTRPTITARASLHPGPHLHACERALSSQEPTDLASAPCQEIYN